MNIKEDSKPGFFKVESSKKDTFYSVDPKKPFCSCPAYKFRRNCKHLEAVRLLVGKRDQGKTKEVVDFVKKEGEVDSIELIEKFGEDVVNSAIGQGDLIEKKGVIRVLE